LAHCTDDAAENDTDGEPSDLERIPCEDEDEQVEPTRRTRHDCVSNDVHREEQDRCQTEEGSPETTTRAGRAHSPDKQVRRRDELDKSVDEGDRHDDRYRKQDEHRDLP
jgi:hypothetical protein